MKNYKKSLTKFLTQRWKIVVIITTLLLLLGYFAYSYFFLGVRTWAEWTGFGEYKSPTGEYYRAKTLWDWLQLLVVPAMLAILALWYNHQNAVKERKASETRYQLEQSLAQDKMKEDSLRLYLEKITELLTNDGLPLKDNPNDKVIIRAYTLLTLRTLDKERKKIILQFLYEAGVINRENTIVSLSGADLSSINFSDINKSTSFIYTSMYEMEQMSRNKNTGPVPTHFNLSRINLSGANLIESKFRYVDLSHSDLRKSDISKAQFIDTNLNNTDLSNSFMQGVKFLSVDLQMSNLSQVDLSDADLFGSNLRNANLSDAKLRRTNLSNVDLSGANLTGCDFSGAKLDDADFTNAKILSGNINIFASQFTKAKSLEGMILPDGKKFEDSESNFAKYIRLDKKTLGK